MANPKSMLTALLRLPSGTLKRQEHEQAESIWDALHRYGSVTPAQRAWVEKRYFDNKLDRPDRPAPPTVKTTKVKVGYIEDASFTTAVRVSTLGEFEAACPQHPKGSPLWQRAAAFLRDAGHVIELRPPKAG